MCDSMQQEPSLGEIAGAGPENRAELLPDESELGTNGLAMITIRRVSSRRGRFACGFKGDFPKLGMIKCIVSRKFAVIFPVNTPDLSQKCHDNMGRVNFRHLCAFCDIYPKLNSIFCEHS